MNKYTDLLGKKEKKGKNIRPWEVSHLRSSPPCKLDRCRPKEENRLCSLHSKISLEMCSKSAEDQY